MKHWRRSEPRVVRPFFAVSDLAEAFSKAELRVGGNGKETANSKDTIHLERADFDGLYITVCPKLDAEDVRARLGERASRVVLALALRDPMFKRRVLHRCWPLSGDLPDRIPLDAVLVEQFGHKHELHLTLALMLDADIEPPLPGWPRQRGALIARRTFKLRPKEVKPSFDLRKMTKKDAEKFTGFAGALVHVEYGGEQLTAEPGEDTQLVTCYLAEGVYDRVQTASGRPLLQELVMTEIVAAVLLLAREDIENAESAPPGTLLANILERLGGDTPMTLDRLKHLVSEPTRLRAAVHDKTDLTRQLTNF